MLHVTRITLLLACCLSWHSALAQAPPLTPGGQPAPVAPAQSYRLYNAGRDRLLITQGGRRIRLRPQGGPAQGASRFVDASGDWRLSGRLGRYELTGPGNRRASLDFSAGGRAAKRVPECPVDCDSDASPASADFTGGPGIAGASRLDIRPASCRSYFTDYPPIERGTRIEDAINRQGGMPGLLPTARTFPQVDWFNDSELVVMHSRDLASASLDGALRPNALFDLLLADAQAIVQHVIDPLAARGYLSVDNGGTRTRIDAQPARRVVLTLLVRHGLASASQRAQIRAARLELAARYGMQLRIIEIP